MFEGASSSRRIAKLLSHTVKDKVVGFGVVDLMARALSARVNPHERDTGAKLRKHVHGVLCNIRPRFGPDNVGLVPGLLRDKGVFRLGWVMVRAPIRSRWRIGRVGRSRRGDVVLKEKIVLVSSATNAAEYVALHEVVHVGAKAINNVMVVPNI